MTAAGNRQQPNQTTSDSPLVQQSAKKSTSKDALTTFIFSQVTVPPLHRWFVLLSCINASGILAKLNNARARAVHDVTAQWRYHVITTCPRTRTVPAGA